LTEPRPRRCSLASDFYRDTGTERQGAGITLRGRRLDALMGIEKFIKPVG
jgi:hypothetical protein